MAELLEFDPLSEDAANSPLSVMTANYRVTAHAYPAPQLNVLYASSIDTEGEIPASRRYSNRQITMSIEMVDATGSLTRALQAKVAKIAREGGTLKRTLATGQVIVFDLLSSEQFDPGFNVSYYSSNLVNVDLVFAAKPFGRGAQVTVSASAFTGIANVQTITGVTGDVPALGKLQISDTSTRDRFLSVWGLQQRYYSSSANAALFYEAEGRTRLNSATLVANATYGSGAGSNTVSMAFTNSYQAMLSTQATGGGAHLTHVGDFRVLARIIPFGANFNDTYYALEWATGDFRSFTRNDPVRLGGSLGVPVLADLGIVSIPSDAARWEGRIVGKATVSGESGAIDALIFIPVTEGSGQAAGNYGQPTPTVLTGLDSFDQTAGALSAKALPTGGTWTTSGATTDFTVSGSGTATRSTTADTSARVAVTTPAAVTTTAASLTVNLGGLNGGFTGPVVRYVSATSFANATVYIDNSTNTMKVFVGRYTGGTSMGGLSGSVSLPSFAITDTVTVQIAVSAGGIFAVWVWLASQSQPSTPVLTGYHAQLDTGGTYASGKVGFYDLTSAGSSNTRTYYDFASWVPPLDAAVFSSRTLEISSTGANRQDSTGSFYAPVSRYEGDYFFVPPAGAEARTSRIVVVNSRADINNPGDVTSQSDAASVQVLYTPRFLVIP
jgi:hypothetical protein